MDIWLILLLVVGLLLPIGVALVTVSAGMPKGGAVNRGLTAAFGKGIALGAAIGLAVSGATIGALIGVACLAGR